MAASQGHSGPKSSFSAQWYGSRSTFSFQGFSGSNGSAAGAPNHLTQLGHHLHCLPLFTRSRQLTAFAGMSPKRRDSGTSVHGKPRLCKQARTRVRAALYLAASAAVRFNPDMKAFYERLLTQGKVRRVALGAVMRKLLVLMGPSSRPTMIGFQKPKLPDGRFQTLYFLHSGAPGCSREGRKTKRVAKGVTGAIAGAPFATLRPSRRADHSRVKEMLRGTLTAN